MSTKNQKILLTGLNGRDSLPYRAALGLLQALQEIPKWEGARLSWDRCAVIDGPGNRDDLLDSLVELYSDRFLDPRWTWPGVDEKGNPLHKGSHDSYIESIKNFEGHSGRLGWIRGTATDQSVREEDGAIMTSSTAWATFTGGSHWSIFKLAHESMKKIAQQEDRRQTIERAIFGPWLCKEKDIHHIGWDHAQTKDNATMGISTKEIDRKSELFILVLSIESLALYPVHSKNQKSCTTGFSENDRCFTYPLWKNPMSSRSVKSLLDHPELHKKNVDREVINLLGITHAFRGYIKSDRNYQGKSRRVTVSRRIA